MVKRIAIYVEGGGSSSSTRDPFRRGMSAFLGSVVDRARQKRMQWRVIPCSTRSMAYRAFVDALEHEPDVFNLLLVDSEEPVSIEVRPWKHLAMRAEDGWQAPPGADDTRCQLMVACMEAWFLADPGALGAYFGRGFQPERLPAASQAESRTRAEIDAVLKRATRGTQAGEYRKIRDGARLLGIVNALEVRHYCKWCDRLFRALDEAVEGRT